MRGTVVRLADLVPINFIIALMGFLYQLHGVYSGFNENILKQLKTRIRKHKINKLFVHN